MDELKTIFNEEKIDFATFEKRLAENSKTIKLANLRGGGYVDAAKYSQLEKDFNTYKEQNDVSKYADYDALKSELETLKAEKADRELIGKLSDKKVRPEFQKFVLSEVKGKVNDKVTFDKALDEYLKDNSQYIEEAQPKTFFKGSSVPLESGSGEVKKTNQKMNTLFRSVRK